MKKHLIYSIFLVIITALSITGCKPKESPPTIITLEATDITPTSVTLSGYISDAGEPPYFEKGIYISKTKDPTVNAKKVIASGTDEDIFKIEITDLTPYSTYYVCTFATNKQGTVYGNNISFSTFNIPVTFTVHDVSFNMILVENGTFTMGCTDNECFSWVSNTPAHQVTLTKDFYMGETEITQELWVALMNDNPSHFNEGGDYPVEMVKWDDIQEFITKLNQLTGKSFRLPTEAEWEYAARGGNKSKGYIYSGSNNLNAVSWNFDSAEWTTHPVGRKKPNELGIYDMSGNVNELCSDWSEEYSEEPVIDPTGPESGLVHIMRGGCFTFQILEHQVSCRSYLYPDDAGFHVGFRLVLEK